jgi:hypothetical protein
LWRDIGLDYASRVSIPRAVTLGLLAAFVMILAAIAGDGLPENIFLALLALPVAALVAAGMFDSGAAGWPWRFARGAVGTVLAGLAGFAAIRWLLANTDWFKITEPLVVLVLAGFAAACGAIAAAAARPSRGLASAIGFILGFVLLMVMAPLLGGTPDHGLTVGFALVLGLGAVVGATLGAVAR